MESLNPDKVPAVGNVRGRDNNELRSRGEVEFVDEEKRVTKLPFNKISRANGTVTPSLWECNAPFPEIPVSESAVNPGKEILSVLNESGPVQVFWTETASAGLAAQKTRLKAMIPSMTPNFLISSTPFCSELKLTVNLRFKVVPG